MKKIILSALVTLSSFIAQANDWYLVGNEVWVAPVMVARYSLSGQRSTNSLIFGVTISQDVSATDKLVVELRESFPDKTVKVYRPRFVEGSFKVPGVIDEKVMHRERMEGWSASVTKYLPLSALDRIKRAIAEDMPLKIKIGHWRSTYENVEVLRETCSGDARETDGVLWFYDRMKAFEKSFDKLPASFTGQKRENLKKFARDCVEVDLDGAKSFADITDNEWRLRPRNQEFVLSHQEIVSKYVEILLLPEESITETIKE